MRPTYQFGDFVLAPARRELCRAGAAVAVPPRAFDAIVYLVEHRDRAVGKDELVAAVWGKADVSDGLLAQTILTMRRAFDDTGREQHYVRTVVRFGYHWVAPTTVVEEPPEALAEATATPVQDDGRGADAASGRGDDVQARAALPAARDRASPGRAAWPRRLLAVGALAGAVVLAAVLLPLGSPPARRPQPATGSIVGGTIAMVLPVDVSAPEGADWVRLGLMDHVAARLRAAGLAVVPSDNVVVLTGATPAGHDARALAEAAGANLIVEPHAERRGRDWRVRLETRAGAKPAQVSEGESGDVLLAARIAADDLARRLGYLPPPIASSGGTSLDALLQQVEAATLADRLDEARALLGRAPADQRDRPEIRLRLAQIDYQAGHLDRAEAAFTAIARDVGAEQDRVLHARATSNLGVIAAVRSDTALAARRFDEAIALLRGQDAPDVLGKALLGRANVAGASDQTEFALQAFAEARVAFENSGNLLALALVDSNLAALDMRRERYAEALPAFRRAADRFATFGSHAAELNALTAVVELDLALLEPDTALALAPRVEDVAALVSDPARQRYAELTVLQARHANGRDGDLEARLARVLAAAARDDDRTALASGHALAARVAFERGDAARAVGEATSALAHFGPGDDAREHARVHMLRIDALLAAGDEAGASEASHDLQAFSGAAGSAAARAYTDLARARTAADEDARATWYARALDEADALRIPLDLREIVAPYAAWLVAHGEDGRAAALAERIAGYAGRDFGSALVQVRVQQALGDVALWRGALARAQSLAGDRVLPAALSAPPAPP